MIDKYLENELKNVKVLVKNIPDDLFALMKSECLNLESNSTRRTGLTSNGVAKHYSMNDVQVLRKLQLFVSEVYDEYKETFGDRFSKFPMLSHDVPLVLDEPWYNLQRKYEYLPVHQHKGFISYSGWVNIPFNFDDEATYEKENATVSCFQFIYCDPSYGSTTNITIKLDRLWEQKMIMFPATLAHCVYPFYNSEQDRISFSGNIMFDTSNLKK